MAVVPIVPCRCSPEDATELTEDSAFNESDTNESEEVPLFPEEESLHAGSHRITGHGKTHRHKTAGESLRHRHTKGSQV